MHRLLSPRIPPSRVRGRVVTGLRGWLAAAWLAVALGLLAVPAHADPVNLPTFTLNPTEEGLLLDFSAKFELSRVVEDALQKGVPLVFVAEATVFQDRWYWRLARRLDSPQLRARLEAAAEDAEERTRLRAAGVVAHGAGRGRHAGLPHLPPPRNR